jgi:hypothetical protein
MSKTDKTYPICFVCLKPIIPKISKLPGGETQELWDDRIQRVLKLGDRHKRASCTPGSKNWSTYLARIQHTEDQTDKPQDKPKETQVPVSLNPKQKQTPKTKALKIVYPLVSLNPTKLIGYEPKISVINQELEHIASFFNKRLFNNTLTNYLITIQSGERAKALGWFSWNRWNDSIHEINISAEYLRADLNNAYKTVLHELCHLYAYQNKIDDCTSNGYHNKKFKAIAETCLMDVTHNDKHGFSTCEISSRLQEIIDTEFKPNTSLFNLARISNSSAGTQTGTAGKGRPGHGKQTTKLKKWICNCEPTYGVRVAIAHFDSTCNICATKFRRAGEIS